jgi:hypothetical protein
LGRICNKGAHKVAQSENKRLEVIEDRKMGGTNNIVMGPTSRKDKQIVEDKGPSSEPQDEEDEKISKEELISHNNDETTRFQQHVECSNHLATNSTKK